MTSAPILLVGAGRMGGALLKGWIARKVKPIVVVEPNLDSATKISLTRNGISLFAGFEYILDIRARACVLALKPQVLNREAMLFRPAAEKGALMISIAAGTSVQTLQRALGKRARIVRAMPNTPGAIGRGITALYAARGVTAEDKFLAAQLLSALGDTVWVRSEGDIDAVTAVSGSGPAYVFLLVEALTEAAMSEGLSRPLAVRLARATVAGAGALLDTDPEPAAALRRNVTSPGGTTEAALEVLMARDGLTALMRRAVHAARKRAAKLGQLS